MNPLDDDIGKMLMVSIIIISSKIPMLYEHLYSCIELVGVSIR